MNRKKNRKLFAGGVLGITSIFGVVGVAQAAEVADKDLGCAFVLCMSAPNPMGIAECKPVIKKVLKLIKKKKKPSCKMMDGREYKYSVFGGADDSLKPLLGDKPPAGLPVLPPLGAGNNLIPIPSPMSYCPKGLTSSTGMSGKNEVVYHTGNPPKDSWKAGDSAHEYDEYRIPMTKLFTKQTGTAKDSLSIYNTYSQRVCVSNPPKVYIIQKNKDGKGQTLHIWVDKAILLKGKEANKRVWVSSKVPNVLGKDPMMAHLKGQEVTPANIEQVEDARDSYIQEYNQALRSWGYDVDGSGSASLADPNKYTVTINGEKKTIVLPKD